jgi:hypothetical protein
VSGVKFSGVPRPHALNYHPVRLPDVSAGEHDVLPARGKFPRQQRHLQLRSA